MPSSLIFLGLLAIVLGPFHLYVWWRLVKGTTRPGHWRTAGTIVLVALVASLLVTFSPGHSVAGWSRQ